MTAREPFEARGRIKALPSSARRLRLRLLVAASACAGLVVTSGVVEGAAEASPAGRATVAGHAGVVSSAGGLRAGGAAPALRRPSRAAASPSGNLLTYDYGNARDGIDTLDPSLGRIGSRPAWSRALAGGIYGQPLVIGNQVIVATEDDVVYALNGSTGAVEWHFSIGAPAREATIRSAPELAGCGDIFPLGITGTPVIDTLHSPPGESQLFVAGEVQRAGTSDWQGIEHVMVAATFKRLSATVRWRRVIDPPGAGSTYLAVAEQQRSALTLSSGRVYAEYGGLNGDCGRYQGYVVSLAESGSGALGSFKVPTSREGAIWSTGGASVGPGGELFVATGNSANTSAGEPFDYGDAVLGLSPSLSTIDSYFAPSDWYTLNADDLDLGSGGPIQLPGGKLIFEIGKAQDNGVSTGYLLDPAALGGIGRPLYSGVGVLGRRLRVRGRRGGDHDSGRTERHVHLRPVPERDSRPHARGDIVGAVVHGRLACAGGRRRQRPPDRRRRPRLGALHRGRRRERKRPDAVRP